MDFSMNWSTIQMTTNKYYIMIPTLLKWMRNFLLCDINCRPFACPAGSSEKCAGWGGFAFVTLEKADDLHMLFYAHVRSIVTLPPCHKQTIAFLYEWVHLYFPNFFQKCVLFYVLFLCCSAYQFFSSLLYEQFGALQ